MPPSEENRKKKKKKMKMKQQQKRQTNNGEASSSSPKDHSSRKKKKSRSADDGDGNSRTKKKQKLQDQRQHEEEREDQSTKKKKRKNKDRKQKSDDGAGGGEAAAGEDAGGGGSSRITDPRFVSVHSDPRFQRVPRNQSKVEIDSRFAHMFSDKRFASSSAPVDKRGKPRRGKRENPLLHYYIHQKEPGEEDEEGNAGDVAEDGKHGGDVKKRLERLVPDEVDLSGSAGSDSSSSSSSDDEEDDDEDDQNSVDSDVAHYLMANHDDTPLTEQATQRLAVVNMDWDHIRAIDIYVVMNSCIPKGGQISSVAIYPSEYGLKCLEIESTHGPSALIYGKQEVDNDSDDDNDSNDDHDGNENEKLRSYELNRLRYYYAVVECDSSTTANHLYEALDGTELLKTSNVFDLRFIPDSMEFIHPARDIAKEAPTNYKEPDFHTRALQHSNVKLSWEEDEPHRKKILRRKFNADQLDELEFKDFLASDEEDSNSDEDDEILLNDEGHKSNKGKKYLALLQSADDSDTENKNDQDMEITFNTGLEDIAKRALEKKESKSETVWQAYLRRRKEKKNARKKNAKYSSEDDESDDSDYQQASDNPDQPDDFFVEDPFDTDVKGDTKGKKDISKIKGKKSKKDKKLSEELCKEQEASQAELELLCINTDRPESPHDDTETRTEKIKKKGKKLPSEDKLPKEDYHDDPRFSALFTSHLYALDPTDPQYKRSATYARQVVQKQKNGNVNTEVGIPSEQDQLPPEEMVQENIDDQKHDEISSRKDKAEFLSLVRSLKRRTEALKAGKKSR